MKSQRRKIPKIPKIDDKALLDWMVAISGLLQNVLDDVYDDISLGSSRHRVLKQTPNLQDLAEGEIVFVLDNNDWYLCTRIENDIKWAKLW